MRIRKHSLHCREITLTLVISGGRCADMDGALRLEDGAAGAMFEYGRLEIFLRGFWSNICDVEAFSPDSAQVACRVLGYDGGSALKFRVPFDSSRFEVEVRHVHIGQRGHPAAALLSSPFQAEFSCRWSMYGGERQKQIKNEMPSTNSRLHDSAWVLQHKLVLDSIACMRFPIIMITHSRHLNGVLVHLNSHDMTALHINLQHGISAIKA